MTKVRISTPASPPQPGRRGRLQALLILAIAAAPVVLGTWAFQIWEGGRTTNYGELLRPTPIDVVGMDGDNRPWKLSASQGKWRLLMIDTGACEEECRRKLLYTRQVRLALGRDQERVARIWITPTATTTNAEVTALVAEAQHVRTDPASLPPVLGTRDGLPASIYLVDPLGNLMMRYTSDPEPRQVIKDLQRLLKYSRTG